MNISHCSFQKLKLRDTVDLIAQLEHFFGVITLFWYREKNIFW